MSEKKELLKVENLCTDLITARGLYHAVRGISFQVHEGEILGIVGESGCGKSMTVKSILRLNQEDKTFYKGKVFYRKGTERKNLLELSRKEMSRLRGREIAMVSQNPMAAFDPLYTVGEQISEMLRFHKGMNREEAQAETERLLELVGIFPGAKRSRQYPHEFSGGMLQRAAIAMMISCGPRLLIADEPTTALDVTMQAQILEILRELKEKMGMSVLLITHNFGVVSEICSRVCVMYAGQVVESGTVEEIFKNPIHPYTRALLRGIPRKGREGRQLETIPGAPPRLNQEIRGCGFVPRCPIAKESCYHKMPEPWEAQGHWSSCPGQFCQVLESGEEEEKICG